MEVRAKQIKKGRQLELKAAKKAAKRTQGPPGVKVIGLISAQHCAVQSDWVPIYGKTLVPAIFPVCGAGHTAQSFTRAGSMKRPPHCILTFCDGKKCTILLADYITLHQVFPVVFFSGPGACNLSI